MTASSRSKQISNLLLPPRTIAICLSRLKMKNREDFDSKEEEITQLKGERKEKDRTIDSLNKEIERKNTDV